MVLVPFIFIIVFHYIPMYGAQIAFKQFVASQGIIRSPWVGLKYFKRLFQSYYFGRVIKNTLGISFYQLAAGFPFPIILALSLNEVRNVFYKKTVQMITYMPYFISTAVIVGIILQVLNPRFGIVNRLMTAVGFADINFMARPDLFKTIYVLSGIWQTAGYGAIIYLAALSAIDPTLHESAIADGATKLQRIWHIDLPGILPTIVILLILRTGSIMNLGFEKVYLMQNPLNLRSSEIISTYVYKMGLLQNDYSFAAAVGLFNSVINFILLITVNQIAKRLGQASLW